ncbi:ECF RNA polymerase sigma factor SigD [Rubripirellula amarantea]|uniref:ECF RNA polymerase sigma factor SigD n=1 Tax=Rubripirellula amarantea TaxID=2527999 RepID=A0A5C5WKU3_9BACT|nr:sigma-70 family RNA polymerase sigma factor [Rubripirellula amarantea]TWT50442.1 ECF RNA polymerase sigma factor SigD [Rubripirellula amarantea]
MTMNEDEIRCLLALATAGDDSALGQLLEQYRPLLTRMTQQQLPNDLQPRVGNSDAVQVSCLSAIRSIKNFDGNDPAEFIAWLTKLHHDNLQDIRRDHIDRDKRSTRRETSGSNLVFRDERQQTGSAWTIQREDRQAVLDALDALPENQAQVIRMRHMDGMKLKEIAEVVDRSPAAVAGLLKRGLKTLREHFDGTNSSKTQ